MPDCGRLLTNDSFRGYDQRSHRVLPIPVRCHARHIDWAIGDNSGEGRPPIPIYLGARAGLLGFLQANVSGLHKLLLSDVRTFFRIPWK